MLDSHVGQKRWRFLRVLLSLDAGRSGPDRASHVARGGEWETTERAHSALASRSAAPGSAGSVCLRCYPSRTVLSSASWNTERVSVQLRQAGEGPGRKPARSLPRT